jgi:lipid-A-disaccharide synthase
MDSPRLFLSAGDPSGDNAASLMMAALGDILPKVQVSGLGGPKLSALGQQQLADPEDLAVLGFWEVTRRYWFFRSLMRRCVHEIESSRPNCIVLVDYPGFNLRLAARVRKLGIPIVYYISPQVWAWGGRRLADMQKLLDRMLLILPFESELYRQHNIPHEFVGHYLLDDMEPSLVASPVPGNNQLGILPGSRHQEIETMLPSMLDAAERIHRRHGFKAVIAGISGRFDYQSRIGPGRSEFVRVTYDDARRVIFESDLVLAASGTATLETGIIGRPMVIVYRTGFVTYHIAKRLVDLPSIGLVNLVLGDKVVPELIQGQATGASMAETLSRYISDPDLAASVWQKLSATAEQLGGSGGSRRAAEIIATYLT